MVKRFALPFLCLIAPALAHAEALSVAADPRAAEAGREILREGGNATDAAMAIMLVLTVVEPQSSGIGGGGYLLRHDGKTGLIDTIDGRETAPASAGPNRFIGPDGQPLAFIKAFPGGLSVGVPGNIRLMEMAHAKWGKLPWAQLFAPAIRLADKGYEILPDLPTDKGFVPQITLSQRLGMMTPILQNFAAARAQYLPNGSAPKPGTVIRNPALAATLRAISRGGPDAFYKGPIAKGVVQSVADSKLNPTTLTEADLAGYRAKERAPICGFYRGYRICGMAPSSSGAITSLMILGLLERFDLKALGKDSPVAWHLIGEAMRLAYADRDAYLGDTDFISAPVAGMLDKGYLATRSQLIAPERTLGHYEPGTPPSTRRAALGTATPEQGTTNFVTMDDDGNIVTMTSTVEGPFGSQLLTGGFFLNNELTDFSFAPGKPNSVAAGKRPLSSMSPTIVYGPDGKVVMALGSAGGRTIIMHVVKALIGVIDWQLPADQAIALPNIFFNGPALLVEKSSPLDTMRPALATLGETVAPADLTSKLTIIERSANGWHGAADPRSAGVALTR